MRAWVFVGPEWRACWQEVIHTLYIMEQWHAHASAMHRLQARHTHTLTDVHIDLCSCSWRHTPCFLITVHVLCKQGINLVHLFFLIQLHFHLQTAVIWSKVVKNSVTSGLTLVLLFTTWVLLRRGLMGISDPNLANNSPLTNQAFGKMLFRTTYSSVGRMGEVLFHEHEDPHPYFFRGSRQKQI